MSMSNLGQFREKTDIFVNNRLNMNLNILLHIIMWHMWFITEYNISFLLNWFSVIYHMLIQNFACFFFCYRRIFKNKQKPVFLFLFLFLFFFFFQKSIDIINLFTLIIKKKNLVCIS